MIANKRKKTKKKILNWSNFGPENTSRGIMRINYIAIRRVGISGRSFSCIREICTVEKFSRAFDESNFLLVLSDVVILDSTVLFKYIKFLINRRKRTLRMPYIHTLSEAIFQ